MDRGAIHSAAPYGPCTGLPPMSLASGEPAVGDESDASYRRDPEGCRFGNDGRPGAD